MFNFAICSFYYLLEVHVSCSLEFVLRAIETPAQLLYSVEMTTTWTTENLQTFQASPAPKMCSSAYRKPQIQQVSCRNIENF